MATFKGTPSHTRHIISIYPEFYVCCVDVRVYLNQYYYYLSDYLETSETFQVSLEIWFWYLQFPTNMHLDVVSLGTPGRKNHPSL